MAQFKKIFYQDLTKPRIIHHCEDVVFTGDNLSEKIGVYLYDNGEPYAGGGTVSGTVINSRGQTVPITTGEISGNLVTVTLEEAALAIPGIIGVYVKLTSGQQIATVLSAKFSAESTETDQTIDPGTIISSVSQLITDIQTAVDSIPPEYTELLAAVAPTFSASTAYTAGSYVWQGGNLYRFTADHAAGLWTGTDAVQVSLAGDLGQQVSDLKSAVDDIDNSLFLALNASNASSYIKSVYMTYDTTYDMISYPNSSNYSTIKFYPIPNNAIKLRITGRSGINNATMPFVTFYDNLVGDPPKELSYITQVGMVDHKNEPVTIPNGALWFSVTFRNGVDYTVEIITDTKEIITDTKETISNIDGRVAELEKETEYRVLIIGDSYSKNGQWVSALQNELNVSSLVNLAVVSASLKDNYQDRTQYPYTSRPVVSDVTGNHNTFMCQIEKLKRLMTGTDLDSGESKIYSAESEYPNVIIIEGGQNDSPDADSVVETYPDQMMKHVTDVYVARTAYDTPTVRDCYIKTPSDEVNRTCFAGAYRALVEELQTLFPKAQIFATSRSLLGYWLSNHFPGVTKIYQQQELSCNMCGINFINWQGGPQINTIMNYPKGNGTQTNPYTYAEVFAPGGALAKMDTYDLLHPTILGGKKYGRVVANAIRANYINIGDA